MSTATFAQKIAREDEPLQSRRPEASLIDWLLGGAVALFAIAWVWPFFSYCFLGGQDEGIILQGSARILRGEIPYRDFFSFYTPGSYYLYAGLFKVFGISLLVARGMLLAYAALFSLLTYLLARRACSRLASLFAASLIAFICLPARFVVVHSWDSSAAALLALYCAVQLLETNAVRWGLSCGFFAGVTVMIEQSKGAGLVLGLGIGGLMVRTWLISEAGRRAWEGLILRAPVVGPLVAQYAMSRFCRMLGTLLGAGVPLINALNVARRSIGNQILVDAVSNSIERVKEGKALGPSLGDCRTLFSGSVLEMVSVAEESGRLDQELVRIANVTENDLDRQIRHNKRGDLNS